VPKLDTSCTGSCAAAIKCNSRTYSLTLCVLHTQPTDIFAAVHKHMKLGLALFMLQKAYCTELQVKDSTDVLNTSYNQPGGT
jgi:hypothetical protein